MWLLKAFEIFWQLCCSTPSSKWLLEEGLDRFGSEVMFVKHRCSLDWLFGDLGMGLGFSEMKNLVLGGQALYQTFVGLVGAEPVFEQYLSFHLCYLADLGVCGNQRNSIIAVF